MTVLPPSAVCSAGLIGGFAAARYSGRRELGGVVLAAAGGWCARQWTRTAGPGAAAGLVGLYVVAMGVSHPLAHRIGAWPSVLSVAAVTAGAAEAVRRRCG